MTTTTTIEALQNTDVEISKVEETSDESYDNFFEIEEIDAVPAKSLMSMRC